MKIYLTTIVVLLAMGVSAQQKPVLPSAAHQQWAEAEIGVMFHFDMPNFVPDYQWRSWGTHPPATTFNPASIDTDQWIATAKAGGAKYAILVAKHCSGFSLWPTKAHEYSVKNSPWKYGKGDLVADFIASCKKYGLRPGIYASAAANGYLWVDNPGKVQAGGPVDQKTYNKIVEQQLTELWSNYGKLFEIWFDGGVQPLNEGGPDVAGLLKKLQPEAVVFQGPINAKNLIRWIGNEDGLAPYPNWSRSRLINGNANLTKEDFTGRPDGEVWCPGETDFPLRTGWQGGWFWKKDSQQLITGEQLLNNYLTSVGRNSNMLIGVVVDTSGKVPAEDAKLLKEFGETLKTKFVPIAHRVGTGKELTLNLGALKTVDGVLIKEDIAKGEHIRAYELHGYDGKQWKKIGEGISVGHKRIQQFAPITLNKLKLVITKTEGTPSVSMFAALNTKSLK